MRKNRKTINYWYLKGVIVVFLLSLSTIATAPDFTICYISASKPVNSYDRLIAAVVRVESGGDTSAFNLIEGAIGAFQIREIRIRDYNERNGTNYKLVDCYNFALSKKIFLFYAIRIGYPNYESIAREWNGSGRTTLDYWKRVKAYL